jgi:hypothetical protein
MTVAFFAPSLVRRFLDLVPRADPVGLQRFDPDDGVLAAAPEEPGADEAAPATRSVARARSVDGLLVSGLWESGPGRRDFKFEFDEWVHILEGEAHVTVRGETQILRAGDVALFRAGLPMTWDVPEHVRKVWVHRHQRRLFARIVRKAAARVRPGDDGVARSL